jgi:hypothetical protein
MQGNDAAGERQFKKRKNNTAVINDSQHKARTAS